MPGLVGVIDNRIDRDALTQLIQRMCAILSHEVWYRNYPYIDEPAAFGRVSLNIINPHPQPIFNSDKSRCIFMEGEIFNQQELKEQFAELENQYPVRNDPELVLKLYEIYGTNFVPALNGSFHFAIWDRNENKLVIVNDRYGLRPVYYSQAAGRFLFAAEVKGILADPSFARTMDYAAVADFLTFQLITGNKTLFDGIQLLPPASILTYHDGKLSLTSFWDICFREDSGKTSEDDYIEHLSYLIRQAVERQMTGDFTKGIFLSGGLDSRNILGAIKKKHHPIHTFTTGIPKTYDVEFARKLAGAVGATHHYKPVGSDLISTFAEKGVWLTDGMMSCEHMLILSLLSCAKNYCECVFDGLGGDGLIGGLYLKKRLFDKVLSEEQVIDYAYTRFVLSFGKDSWEQLFTDSFLPKVRDMPFESFKTAALMPTIKHPANRNDYIYFKNRQRRFIFFGSILTRSQLECRTPFYDNDLVDFAHTIPPYLKLGKRLHLKLLQRFFPELAKVPWTYSGISINASTPGRVLFQRGFYRAQRIVRDRLYAITSARFVPQYRRNSKDVSLWLRRDLRQWTQDLLLSKLAIDRGYFKYGYIRKLLEEHMSGKKDHMHKICTLITFEFWHRLFID